MNKKDNGDLKDLKLFSAFDDATLAEFLKAFSRRELRQGDVIFREGEEGSTFYIVLCGEIAIEKRLDKAGKKWRKLAVLKRGEYFGEMAVLEGKPRFAQARAITAAEVIEIERARLMKFIADYPREGAAMLIQILLVMLHRLRHTSDDLMAAHGFMEVLAKYSHKR
ncbi:MAG: cyclic nucleotide-binding domain-containing protein [Elusimicrobiales bacterium]